LALALGSLLSQSLADVAFLRSPIMNADINEVFGGARDLAARFMRGICGGRNRCLERIRQIEAARSSAGKNTPLITVESQVRILPGVPLVSGGAAQQ
jgi:hypothetical protein